jgi:hypothetical protein
MDKKIRCVGGLKPEDLTADQKSKLERFVKAGGNGLIAIECYTNLDKHIDEEIPGGTVFIFAPDAIVDSTLISDSIFQTLCVAQVNEAPYQKELNDSVFTNLEISNTIVPQYVPVESSITDGVEHGPWLSELGGPSSFVGVYSQMREDHQGKDYFIAGRGTAPTSVIQHFKSEVDKYAPTYGQLVRDIEWKKHIDNGYYMAARNVNRNLAQVAQSFNVGISRMLDFSSVTKSPSHGVGERAQPEFTQRTYSVEYGKTFVAFYNNVCINQKDKHLLVSNPAKDGIYVFPRSDNNIASPIPADTKNGMTKLVKQVMKLDGGWNPEDHIGIMVPLVTKVFDNKLRSE